MTRLQEVAKFGAGVAAWEAVVHASLYASGATVRLFGWTLSPAANLVQTLVPGVVAIALGLYAWGRGPGSGAPRARSSAR